MIIQMHIKRDKLIKTYEVEADENDSVATLLERINLDESDPIEWECGCRQNICGACAMLINNTPALACASFVGDLGPNINLAPLSKFPLIKDLKVDRSIIATLLEKMQTYPLPDTQADTSDFQRQYLAASCLMCGCCMEVCPNYTGKDDFGSALVANIMYKTISQEADKMRRKELSKLYRKKQFIKCTNALSCDDVCPLGLPQASTLSRLNHTIFKHK